MYSLRSVANKSRTLLSLANTARIVRTPEYARFNSTLAEGALDEASIPNQEAPAKAKKQPSLPIYISYLASLVSKDLQFDEFLEKVSDVLAKELSNPEQTQSDIAKKNNIAFMKTMTYLTQSKNVEASKANTAYRFLTVLKENGVATTSHFNKVMELYFLEDKPDDAMSVFVEALEYGKLSKGDSGNQIQSTLYISYLKSCFNKGQSPSLEVYKAITSSDKFKINNRQFYYLLKQTTSTPEFEKFVSKSLKEHFDESADPNDPRFISDGLEAALNHQVSNLEKNYNYIINAAKSSGKPITEETYRKMMHMFTTGLKPTRSQAIWNLMVEKIGTPSSVETWNELLYSYSKVKAAFNAEKRAENTERLETIFKYIDENFTLNSSTLAYYLSGLLANEEFEKAFSVVQKLSGPGMKGVKMDDNITHSYLMGLVQAKKLKEASNLFDSFVASGYKPNIRILNSLLSAYNKQKNYAKCDELVETIHKFNLKPDVATYTILIDNILKNSANATSSKLDNLLSSIITDMHQNGISFANSVTLTAIVSGLAAEASLVSVRLLVDYMKSKKIKIPFMMYTSVINAECLYGEISIAKQMFKESIEQGVKPSASYYNNIISGCLKAGSMRDALQYYDAFKNDKALVPNFYTYYFLLRKLLYSNRFDKNTTDMILKDLAYNVEHHQIPLGKVLPGMLAEFRPKGAEIPPALEKFIK